MEYKQNDMMQVNEHALLISRYFYFLGSIYERCYR